MRTAVLVFLISACGPVTEPDDDGEGGNSAPTDISLSAARVGEQAVAGTVIGTFASEDSDAGDSHSYALIENPGGLFEVVGDVLQVAPGAVIDFEAGAARRITVRSSDSGGGTIDGEFEIQIDDIREVVNLDDAGAGSLRQACADAAPGETILFESGLTGTISIQSPILLSKAVTLRGPLDRSIELDGNDLGHIIEVGFAADAVLSNLKFTRGKTAISVNGTLSVLDGLFEDSTTTQFGRGGAIANLAGGKLVVADTTFRNNTGFNGGAIAADGAETTIASSTFVDNATSGNSGGAIVGGPMKVINCTFSGNAATGSNRSGGALALFGGMNVVAFSTFVGNSSTGNGGGVFASNSITGLELRGSIFLQNVGANAPDFDAGTSGLVTGSDNILANGAGSGFTDAINNNLVSGVVQLGALVDNGGPTVTFRPAGGSLEIDYVPAAKCTNLANQPLLVDQRGRPRPIAGGCEAGAVEAD